MMEKFSQKEDRKAISTKLEWTLQNKQVKNHTL